MIEELHGRPKQSQLRSKIRNEVKNELEKEWIDAIGNLIVPPKPTKKCKFVADMERAAEEIVRTRVQLDKLSCLQMLIVGPQYSGKSTFLSVLLAKLGQEIGKSGMWHNIMIYSIDFANIDFTNPLLVYQAIIESTFAQFTSQDTRLKPYSQKTAAYFKQIPEGTSTFPKRISLDSLFPFIDREFTKISKDIKSLWTNNNSLQFIEASLALPARIGKLLGSKNVIYVIDHFELCDVDFLNERRRTVNIAPLVKGVLKNIPFLVCCRNEENLLQLVRSLDSGHTDLAYGLTVFNIADIEIRIKKPAGKALIVSFSDKIPNMKITLEDCGGCIAFVAEWTEIARLAAAAQTFERTQGTTTKNLKCDQHVICLDRMRKFLPRLLHSDEQLPLGEIDSVRIVI